jgi:hypothetical protein
MIMITIWRKKIKKRRNPARKKLWKRRKRRRKRIKIADSNNRIHS